MAARNFKLTLAYDGTDFYGWQKTSTGPSIEGTLQEILEQILQEPIDLQAASRTDRGVHAYGQVVNFFSNRESLSLERLKQSLNRLLPKSMAVLSLEMVDASFHPTLDCTGKEYHYTICYGEAQIPQLRLYAWHYPYALDMKLMKDAAKILTGTHDFAAVCNFKKNAQYQHYVRTVTEIAFEELPQKQLRFKILGAHFLYKMVRNLVGTLLYVGRGKIAVEELLLILSSGDRTKAGVTAPAHGLSLFQVFYN